eukprot:PhF_6_TR6603/c0_g1_i1/m.9709
MAFIHRTYLSNVMSFIRCMYVSDVIALIRCTYGSDVIASTRYTYLSDVNASMHRTLLAPQAMGRRMIVQYPALTESNRDKFKNLFGGDVMLLLYLFFLFLR